MILKTEPNKPTHVLYIHTYAFKHVHTYPRIEPPHSHTYTHLFFVNHHPPDENVIYDMGTVDGTPHSPHTQIVVLFPPAGGSTVGLIYHFETW